MLKRTHLLLIVSYLSTSGTLLGAAVSGGSSGSSGDTIAADISDIKQAISQLSQKFDQLDSFLRGNAEKAEEKAKAAALSAETDMKAREEQAAHRRQVMEEQIAHRKQLTELINNTTSDDKQITAAIDAAIAKGFTIASHHGESLLTYAKLHDQGHHNRADTIAHLKRLLGKS